MCVVLCLKSLLYDFVFLCCVFVFFFQAEDGIRDLVRSRGLGDVYKRQVICMAVGGASIAQQDPQFTQYMFDRLSVNPAVAGISGELCGTLLLRQQWTGFDGAPKTALLNASMPINKISSGVGISVYLDKLGQQNSTFARLHYSFHRKIGTGTLGIGIYLGAGSHALGHDWLARDPVAQDDAISSASTSQTGFDLGAVSYTHLTLPTSDLV